MTRVKCNESGTPGHIGKGMLRFARNEDGSLIIFGFVLFMLMVMMGGLAVDLMRYEQKRTHLQQTNDRATLAAASFTNDIPADDVVADYYDKEGLSESLTGIVVDEGLNFKQVTASATIDTNPFFLHLMGIEDLDAHSYSSAEQRINNVEIVLVLDVSGSMAGAKLANLKTAAMEFVDTVLANDTENRISIAIVPYNAQVNLGPTLRGKYNATYQHGTAQVDCLEVPTSSYSTATLSRTLAIPMYAYADVASTTSQSTSYVNRTDTSNATATNFWCNKTSPASVNIVRLPMRNATTIKANINALQAGGNTSIMLGMKWGLTLLDEGARPMFDQLVATGNIPDIFLGRPFDWTDEDAMKVIVLMTDGEHVAHDKVNDGYKTGLSPIWRSSGDGNYSIKFTSGRPSTAGPAANQYFVPHLCTTSGCRNGTNVAEAWKSAPYNSTAGGSVATQQNWNQVWSSQRLSWVAWQLYARALGTSSGTRTTAYNNAMTAFKSEFASVATMNTQLQQSCTLARTNGVQVYGIAFEAPANGQTQIRSCSTSTSHYWDANGLEIRTAFRAIASQISLLRLTQ